MGSSYAHHSLLFTSLHFLFIHCEHRFMKEDVYNLQIEMHTYICMHITPLLQEGMSMCLCVNSTCAQS